MTRSSAATVAAAPPAPEALDPSRRPVSGRLGRGGALGLGLAMMWLSLLVLIPLAAVVLKSFSHGADNFWAAVTAPDALAALKLTVEMSLLVSLVDVVMGTLIAWVLVRDEFWGKRVFEVVIDLPFALPTIVAGPRAAGALRARRARSHVNLAQSRGAVFLALLFVTLPFVVRTVQPVLIELDRDMEEAAASLGREPVRDLPPHHAAQPGAGHRRGRGACRSPGRSASTAPPC